MISSALQFTSDALDQFLRNRFGLDESKVQLNTLIESNGSVPEANQNKIVISIINVDQETNKAYFGRNKRLPGGAYSDTSPAERFNLDVLVSATFDVYAEALRFLGAAIFFFQVNNCMDGTSFSNFPPGIAKIEFDVEKVNYVQMQGLWTSMGAKYVPSTIYKMRLLSFQGNEPKAFVPAISKISNEVTV